MKLSISNIGWEDRNDGAVYQMMKAKGFTGLEIAPTRIFPNNPYDHIADASNYASKIYGIYGFCIPSMQSIWYGKQEKLFGTKEERKVLVDYTKKAIDFAEAVGCKNLVFGCPRNRVIPEDGDESIAINFFKEIGDYAYTKHTVIGMEANPPIYNTNYINDTPSALELIKKVNSEGFKLNLDVGTMIENGESVEELIANVKYINHVHISEPNLNPIQQRDLHKELKKILLDEGYNGFISIEMKKNDSLDEIERCMDYVKDIFEGNV